ncbi:conserved hypothetical protein [Roseibium sp. TrichSKD4]|uniref:hypothetical protein n=1 Tax=Roseibium sp. TrichSKD4 TaxID=744980 RepID=UPI0001E57442|nr:hypothetical protein [Roseibium sp. TrichSKD4]EFO30788.1 conserved hypothetical protein [Roseibium sp. TrichSKD4]
MTRAPKALSLLTLPVLFALIFILSATNEPSAQGTGGARVYSDQQEGWVEDMAGMRHYSGLRCPDLVGPLARAKVLAADADRVAGCIYLGRDGINAILRKHVPGSGRQSTYLFKKNYSSAGFQQVQLTGVSASGVSFKTRQRGDRVYIETMWQFEGEKADFTLWLYYILPKHETDIAATLEAFKVMLARQN